VQDGGEDHGTGRARISTASRRPADRSRSNGVRESRIGLLGGTFDPPHIAHLAAAATVRHVLGLDEVWMVPAHRPWQKVGTRPLSPAADRWAMVQALVEGAGEGIVASTVELDRGGDTYTADTLAELHAEDPGRDLFVILGADAASGLTSWIRADEVREGAVLVLVDRPGQPAPAPPAGWTFERVTMPRLDVSSTDLRRRVADGEPIDGLVPPAVAAYIHRHGLYREQRP
jgi:nicotinate-nucleotide adenylyltransferase